MVGVRIRTMKMIVPEPETSKNIKIGMKILTKMDITKNMMNGRRKNTTNILMRMKTWINIRIVNGRMLLRIAKIRKRMKTLVNIPMENGRRLKRLTKILMSLETSKNILNERRERTSLRILATIQNILQIIFKIQNISLQIIA